VIHKALTRVKKPVKMGQSLTSFHVRERDQEAVASALRFGRFTPAWVSPSSALWVSAFAGPAESRNLQVLNRIGINLSRTLDTYVWSVLLHNSTVLLYTLFEQGEIKAEYDSFPELAESRTRKYREMTNGKPGLMVKLCPVPVSVGIMEQVLFRKPLAEAIREVMAEEKLGSEEEMAAVLPEDYIQERIMVKRGYQAEEERLAELASLLDVPNVLFTFQMLEQYFQEGRRGLVLGEEDFLRVAR